VKVTVIRESRAIDVARNVTNGGALHPAVVPAPAPEPDSAPQVQPDAAA
jgi:hypothetical protein